METDYLSKSREEWRQVMNRLEDVSRTNILVTADNTRFKTDSLSKNRNACREFISNRANIV